MYESFFGLSERPFMAAPRAEHYFPAPSAELARTTLLRVIARDEGPALLMGGSGLGKTLVASVLCRQLQQRCAVAYWGDGHLTTRHGLLQAVLFALGRPYRDMNEGELRLALIDYLCRSDECPQGMLLVVDEAHRLPGRLLEELRLIGDMSRHGRPCVRLLLVGSMALEERFTHPRLEAFSARLAARCYLEPFTCPDTVEFMQHRMESCGVPADEIFSDEALEAIHAAADGNPRAVSQLADHALVLAFQDSRRRIDEGFIQNVWADLQQLPVTWQTNGRSTSSRGSSGNGAAGGSVIEFGALGDDEDDAAVATETAAVTGPAKATQRPMMWDDEGAGANSRVEIAGVETTAPEAVPAEASLTDTSRSDTPRSEESDEVVDVALSTDHDDVFGTDFSEEVDIVDRYTSLELARWAELPRVSSREGLEISRVLRTAGGVVDVEAVPNDAAAAKSAREWTHLHIAAETSPEDDELDDTRLVSMTGEDEATEPMASADEVAVSAEPLRLIVIDEEDDEVVPPEPAPAATLVRGANLPEAFRRLRRG
ncbi:MAG: AAA family ATPase [Pirellulales bacterium]